MSGPGLAHARAWRVLWMAACGLVCGATTARAQGAWRVVENARLDESAYYDGDSFWLRAGRHRAIYRIYFVDAPEMDRSVPERVRDQARYWGITEDEVIALGQKATRFARDFMRGGFTLHTRRQDARGRPGARRYFGMIEKDGETLCAALVRAGLGRVFGFGTDLPDGTPADRHWALLRRLKREARAEGRGGWGLRETESRRRSAAPVTPEVDAGPATVVRTTTAFVTEPPHRVPGRLRAAVVVEEVDAVSPTRVRIRVGQADAEVEGLVERADLHREAPTED